MCVWTKKRGSMNAVVLLWPLLPAWLEFSLKFEINSKRRNCRNSHCYNLILSTISARLSEVGWRRRGPYRVPLVPDSRPQPHTAASTLRANILLLWIASHPFSSRRKHVGAVLGLGSEVDQRSQRDGLCSGKHRHNL